jgi:hypothetical protein
VKYPGNSLVREVSPGTLPGSEQHSHTDTQFRSFSNGKRSSDDGVHPLRSACHISEASRYIRAQKVVKRHPVKLYIIALMTACVYTQHSCFRWLERLTQEREVLGSIPTVRREYKVSKRAIFSFLFEFLSSDIRQKIGNMFLNHF